MRGIKLCFTDKKYLDALESDPNFMTDINYLNPYRNGNLNLILFDPIAQHNHLDSEVVVLSKVARAIKRLFFSNTNYNVEFLNPILNEQKGGLVHNTDRIIDSTDIQITNFNITVN